MGKIFFLIVSLAIFAAPPAEAAFCGLLFKKGFSDNSPAPLVHTGNLDSLNMARIGKKIKGDRKLGFYAETRTGAIDFEQLSAQEPMLRVSRSMRIGNDNFIETVDPLGRRFYFRKTLDDQWFSYEGVPYDSKLFPPLKRASPSISKRTSSFTFKDKTSWAQKLAQSQASGSQTAKEEFKTAELLRDKLYEANLFSLNKITQNQNWTLSDLAGLNRLVEGGITQGKAANAIGFVRGTKTETPNGLIDLSQYQSRSIVQKGSTFKTETKTLFDYVPANQVPAAMEEWLNRFNSVNASTSLETIMKIYQDFIKIHPFIEANGRTSKVLLDHMFLRANFNPVAGKSDLGQSMYKSVEDLVDEANTAAAKTHSRYWNE